MARKFKGLVFLTIAALYLTLIWAALSPRLPTLENPILFYTNQNRDDLRLVLKKLFSSARHSIDITMYAVTDEELLRYLHTKRDKAVQLRIFHDKSNPVDSPFATPIQAKGLMHRKIVTIDDRIVLLGSANMTTTSLLMHDNLSVAFYHPQLAQFLKQPTTSPFNFSIGPQNGTVWLLPDPTALAALQSHLAQAQSSIFIAMFTLTHPQLLQTVIEAHQRGVAVTIALDRYAARGASQKAVKLLQVHNIPLVLSQGPQLLHHKWAYIDRSKLFLGSTNWTKAAFTKNQDCLLLLDNLTLQQQTLFDTIASEMGVTTSVEDTLFLWPR